MKFFYENKPLDRREGEKIEKEKDLKIPIIDIIRHGQTDYKELRDPNFKFNPEDKDFKLDAEHLDLTPEGITNILKTGELLAGQINKDQEVILFLTSPNFRAQSSMLLLQDYLAKNGFNILNKYQENERSGYKIKKSSNLRQIEFKKDGPASRVEWIEADKQYRLKKPTNVAPDVAHPEIAASLGLDMKDVFQEDYGDINNRFEHFLRHISNIYSYFNPETKKVLQDKVLRVIAVTHEELPVKFLKKIFNDETSLKRAQILEINPLIKSKKMDDYSAKVKIYPQKPEDRGSEVYINKEFHRGE